MGHGDDKTDEPIEAVRYVGELDPLNLPHGFGCEVDSAGKMIAGRSGEWVHGLLFNESFVPH